MATTRYVWDVVNDNYLSENDGTSTTAVYTNEPSQFGELASQRRGGTSNFYHFDGQGSTRALTDASENVTDTDVYSAFGESVASTGATTNPFGYRGALGYYANPSTSDWSVHGRIFEPDIARWLSRDTSAMGSYRYAITWATGWFGSFLPREDRVPPGVSNCCRLCAKANGAIARERIRFSPYTAGDGFQGNAMLHCLSSCMTRRNCGESCRKAFWDGRESPFDSLGRTVRWDDLMDLRNNAVGADCGSDKSALEGKSCWGCCLNALRAGQLSCEKEGGGLTPCPFEVENPKPIADFPDIPPFSGIP